MRTTCLICTICLFLEACSRYVTVVSNPNYSDGEVLYAYQRDLNNCRNEAYSKIPAPTTEPAPQGNSAVDAYYRGVTRSNNNWANVNYGYAIDDYVKCCIRAKGYTFQRVEKRSAK